MFHTENTQHAEADLSRTPAWQQLQQPEDEQLLLLMMMIPSSYWCLRQGDATVKLNGLKDERSDSSAAAASALVLKIGTKLSLKVCVEPTSVSHKPVPEGKSDDLISAFLPWPAEAFLQASAAEPCNKWS